MASLSAAIDLAHAPPEHILRLYNVVLVESSRRVRDRSLFLHPDGNENIRIIVDSISRVIWRQNYKLARNLIARSTLAAQFLEVRDKKVFNKDPVGFEDLFMATRSAEQTALVAKLQNSLATTKSINVRKQLKGRLSAARRMQSIFWPSGRKLKLAGLRIPVAQGDPIIVADPVGIQNALKDYWAPVYAHHEMDQDAAIKLFNIFRRSNFHLFQFSNLPLPDSDFYEEYIPRLRDSATGKNGIPYSAYKAIIPLSAHIFSEHTKYMSSSAQPAGLEIFNQQLMWFAPKGVSAEDDLVVYREPSQLRTIFGSNTDCKIVAGAIALLQL